MSHKVFLSYTRADREFARQLGMKIRSLGAEVIADDLMRPGEDWQEFLRSALEAADALVYLAPEPGTENANSALFEAGAARALGKPVIAVLPVRDPARERELPVDIRSTQVLDGSRLEPDALAKSIVATLDAA